LTTVRQVRIIGWKLEKDFAPLQKRSKRRKNRRYDANVANIRMVERNSLWSRIVCLLKEVAINKQSLAAEIAI